MSVLLSLDSSAAPPPSVGAAEPIARTGDRTSHNGTVISIAVKTICNDLPVVTIGATHICGIPIHGTNAVVAGSSTVFVEDMPISRIGDTCTCGANIIQGSPDALSG